MLGTILGDSLHYIFMIHILYHVYNYSQTRKLKPRHINLLRSQGESVTGLGLNSGLQGYKASFSLLSSLMIEAGKKGGVNSIAFSKLHQETCWTSQKRGMAWLLCTTQNTRERGATECTKNKNTASS